MSEIPDALNILQELKEMKIPLKDKGWEVRIGSYAFFPHSHVKLLVIDGQKVVVAGYNLSSWHWSREQGGRSLHDLGIEVHGTGIGTEARAIFTDLWGRSQELYCPEHQVCTIINPLEVGKTPVYKIVYKIVYKMPFDLSKSPYSIKIPISSDTILPIKNTERAYLLYRRSGHEKDDAVILTMIDNIKKSLDLIEADITPSLYYLLVYFNSDNCSEENGGLYLKPLPNTLAREVKIRLITINYGECSLTNKSGVHLLKKAALEKKLSHLLEVRFYHEKMHTKALFADEQLVMVGSSNSGFSSWGSMGLSKANLITNNNATINEYRDLFNNMWNHSSIAP